MIRSLSSWCATRLRLADSLLVAVSCFSILETFIELILLFLAYQTKMILWLTPVAITSLVRTTAAISFALNPRSLCSRRGFVTVEVVLLESFAAFLYSMFLFQYREAFDRSQGTHLSDTLLDLLYACSFSGVILAIPNFHRALLFCRRTKEQKQSRRITLEDITAREFVVGDTDEMEAALGFPHNRDSCCVCLDDLSVGDLITQLICHHKFHKSCVSDWVKHREGSRIATLCPMRCDLFKSRE
eukprot:TRINITY_DN58574_c0_g1_i1.p1 TRINITY_DN58574_c0_g1~~TRINITY_DN58574_c0_g1_i1.p1  ORF type:complete len:243 (-),score=5.75 TRINITY_DN58574_c0_g1_i1:602-1330(-)